MHRTNSLLNLLRANENNIGLSFNYDDINSYEGNITFQNLNVNSNSASNINTSQNINLNINDNDNTIKEEENIIHNINYKDIQNNNNNNENNNYIFEENNNNDNMNFDNQNIIAQDYQDYPNNNNINNDNKNQNEFYNNKMNTENNNDYNNNNINYTNSNDNNNNNNNNNINYTNGNGDDNNNNIIFNYANGNDNNNNNNNSFNISQEIKYSHERFSKLIEENNLLKDKIIELDSDNKINKAEKERQILIIRDENSKLQLEIQRLIGQEKISYNNYQSDLEEKEKNINNLKNVINNLKNNINTLKEKIKELSNENISLLNNIQNLNNEIMSLTSDKQFLIEQMNELNISLSNKIKPKLRQNEDYLLSLEKTIILLKKDNESLIQNDIKQKKIINNYKEENKKLQLEIEKLNSIKNLNLKNGIYAQNQYKTNINNNNNISNISLNESFCEEDNKYAHNYFTGNNNFSINNINNSKIKRAFSERFLNFANFSNIKSRNNYNYNYNIIKKNEIKNKIFNDDFENGSYENDKKRKPKYLYYNSTIKKKDNKDFSQNDFYHPENRLHKSGLNIKIKNLNINDIEDNKENSIFFNHDNQNSDFNLSQNKSLLSSYTEDM